MPKKMLKSVALVLMLSVLLLCLAGCKAKKDVYSAASDFIKVSHPDKPNTNVFSDGSYDSSKTSSQDNSGTLNSEGSASSEDSASGTPSGATVSDDSESSGGNTTGNDKTGASGILPSDAFDGSGNNRVDTPVEGDQGPVVEW